MAHHKALIPLSGSAVVDAKPLRTLTPMFPAPLGLRAFTPQNSPSFVCVTPFGPYAGGMELGMPAGVSPMFAAPAAPAVPSQGQPQRVNMNGAAHANGTVINSLVTPSQTPPSDVAPSLQTPLSAATPSLQTPLSAATPESGKRKRGRPKRLSDTTVPSAPPATTIPPIPSLPWVPSAPLEGGTPMPSAASAQEVGKRKRGRPKRVQDVPVMSSPLVPQADDTQAIPAPSVHESGTRKRGRSKRFQDSPDTSMTPVHSKDNEPTFQTPATTLPESGLEVGKRKRGRPKRVQGQDVPVMSTPLVPQVDDKPVLQAIPAPTVYESGMRKRGRPKHFQDSPDTSTTPVHSKDNEPTFQTPATTSPESGKRKRGRPRRVSDGSVTPSSIDDVTGDATKHGRSRKIDTTLLQLPSLSSDDPRESAGNVLMMFDALRRRLTQLDEVKQAAKQQHNLKAGSIMINAELRANKNKRIGVVPGVEVGDMFYFRIEMCLVGLNSQSMAGIDYMSAKFGNEEDPVAISIVSAGVYDNTEDDPDVLVYTGQGMSGKDDQKLERGNLALERSLHRGNLIRVIRSIRDLTCPTGKVYIYDGLYKIKETWVEKAKSGFNVFKHKLLREPGQPDGIAMWKKTEKWRENPSSRDHVILCDISYGVQRDPVCVVNEVDDEKGPIHFTYTTKLNYGNLLTSMRKMQGCKCTSVCLPGDSNCSCTHQNAGDLPYSASGILVSRMPMLYECNDSCTCSHNCRTRVVQKGTQVHFEVFKTGDRGWGLRSWDPIRAGTFICEYAGEIVDKNSVDGEDDYIFETLPSEHNLKWNYAPELLGEPNLSDSNETPKQLPITISAKRIGNVARFMNHSCSPNVFWQPVLYDHGDEGYPHIAFFAIKHIPPMTELTYDYGQSQGNKLLGSNSGCRKSKNCLCWSRKCRGSFG